MLQIESTSSLKQLVVYGLTRHLVTKEASTTKSWQWTRSPVCHWERLHGAAIPQITAAVSTNRLSETLDRHGDNLSGASTPYLGPGNDNRMAYGHTCPATRRVPRTGGSITLSSLDKMLREIPSKSSAGFFSFAKGRVKRRIL